MFNHVSEESGVANEKFQKIKKKNQLHNYIVVLKNIHLKLSRLVYKIIMYKFRLSLINHVFDDKFLIKVSHSTLGYSTRLGFKTSIQNYK